MSNRHRGSDYELVTDYGKMEHNTEFTLFNFRGQYSETIDVIELVCGYIVYVTCRGYGYTSIDL